uniref:Uncharacterized protein n=1 Tax=Pipistrellus kuhlii TaxID=59472 RepID=A0A7J7QVU9_PIPKU|nr:hypothetical protein mPipKuh1_008338 [Pipistrellus kuhlii]
MQPGAPQPAAAGMSRGPHGGPTARPEAGVCSLALPSDLQLDRRGAQGPEAERLRAARVQEQVRARLLQLGQQPRHNGTAEPDGVPRAARGRRGPGGRRAGWGGAEVPGPEAWWRLAPGFSSLTHGGRTESPAPPWRAWEKPWVGPPSTHWDPGASHRAWGGPCPPR